MYHEIILTEEIGWIMDDSNPVRTARDQPERLAFKDLSPPYEVYGYIRGICILDKIFRS
jgi:hypothetical protein